MSIIFPVRAFPPLRSGLILFECCTQFPVAVVVAPVSKVLPAVDALEGTLASVNALMGLEKNIHLHIETEWQMLMYSMIMLFAFPQNNCN